MRKKIRKGLICILILAGMCFLYLAYREYRPFLDAGAKEEAVKGVAIIDGSPDDPLERKIDFGTLQGINPDIIGWLYIPQIGVDAPVLQGADDSMYLYTDFEGNYSPLGSIFTWSHADRSLSDGHVCLFAHNTTTGQMFGRLGELTDPEQDSLLYLYTPERAKELKVASAFECRNTDDVFQDGWQGDGGCKTVTLATCTGFDATPWRLAVNCEVVREKLVL